MKTPFFSKPLPVETEIDGLSLKSIQEHQKLYEGYVKKTNEVQEKIVSANLSEANAVYSFIGELKRQETFAVNGMKLHELYFSLLGGDGIPSGVILSIIERDFGSFDKWKEDFIATGMCSRGWAVLAYDWDRKCLQTYGSDAQNVGAVWNATLLLPMDVYEHAFFMDHGTNKRDYIDAFLKTVKWDVVNSLLEKYGLNK